MLRLAVVALAVTFAAALLRFGLIANYVWEGAELIFFSIFVFAVRSLCGSKHGRLGGPSL
jgi:hypothetical protein